LASVQQTTSHKRKIQAAQHLADACAATEQPTAQEDWPGTIPLT